MAAAGDRSALAVSRRALTRAPPAASTAKRPRISHLIFACAGEDTRPLDPKTAANRRVWVAERSSPEKVHQPHCPVHEMQSACAVHGSRRSGPVSSAPVGANTFSAECSSKTQGKIAGVLRIFDGKVSKVRRITGVGGIDSAAGGGCALPLECLHARAFHRESSQSTQRRDQRHLPKRWQTRRVFC